MTKSRLPMEKMATGEVKMMMPQAVTRLQVLLPRIWLVAFIKIQEFRSYLTKLLEISSSLTRLFSFLGRPSQILKVKLHDDLLADEPLGSVRSEFADFHC